jgi:hypothetical protein
MPRQRIPHPTAGKSKRGRIPTPEAPQDYDQKPPLFSLERVQEGEHGYSALTTAEKAAFADSIYKRSGLKWIDLRRCDRHKLGTELIPRGQITAPIPAFITEDQDSFMVMRFSGKKPIIGFRERNIFYIIWFDRNFKVYPH